MKPKSRLLTCSGIFLALAAALLCLTFGLLAQFYGIDGPSAQVGELRAVSIVSALGKYKNDTGSYPVSLSMLSPNYLTSIPRPAWRWPYAYEYELRKNGAEYVLLFMQGRNMDGDYCGYSSQTEKWLCADSTRPY